MKFKYDTYSHRHPLKAKSCERNGIQMKMMDGPTTRAEEEGHASGKSSFSLSDGVLPGAVGQSISVSVPNAAAATATSASTIALSAGIAPHADLPPISTRAYLCNLQTSLELG